MIRGTKGKSRKAKKRGILKEVGTIKEPEARVIDNLTGGQLQDILDLLIFESVAPIVKTSDVFDVQIAHLLSTATRNKKRKLSALPREDFITTLCQALVVGSRDRKIEIISEAKIERGFIYKFVVNFLQEASDYATLYHSHLVCRDVQERRHLEARLGATEKSLHTSRDVLFSTLHTTQDYLNLMYEFRNNMVNNYVKFAYQQARAFSTMKGSNFSFDDVYQNFLTIVTKAIDKYDASKGALTSYVKWWILNAQTTPNNEHGHEYGIAYTLPQMQKKSLATNGNNGTQVNFSVSLNKLVSKDGNESELEHHLKGADGVDEALEKKQELDNIRYLIKRADIKGLARLSLEVDEVMSKKELRLMRLTMKSQLGGHNET